MLKELRETVKRLPIGSALHDAYMRVKHKDGVVLTIERGPLAGLKWVRYNRTFNPEYIDGTYEPRMQEVLTRFLRPGMTFYDVGANAGYFTLFGAHLVGDQGRIVAIEGHPKTAHQLRRQIAANGGGNVTLIPKAVSDKVGTAEFADDTIAVMASLAPENTDRRTVHVETTTLDTIAGETAPPDMLKIDIEGAEIAALNGARNTIAKHRPILLVEVHSPEIAAEYEKLMNEFGYSSSTLDATGDRFVSVPN